VNITDRPRNPTSKPLNVAMEVPSAAEHRASQEPEEPEPPGPDLTAVLNAFPNPHALLQPLCDGTGRIGDFTYFIANSAACQENFTTREALLGARLFGENPAAAAETLRQALIHTAETGRPLILDDQEFPRQHVHSERRYDLRAGKLDDLIALSWCDATRRHEVSSRYRLLTDNTSDIVYETDRLGMIMWISPSVEQTLGLSVAALIGTRATDLIDGDDRAALALQAAAVEAGDSPLPTECRFLTAENQSRWMQVNAQHFYDGTGDVVGAVVGLRDCHREVVARRAAATLSAGSAAIALAASENELLAEMCQIAVDEGGYRFSWFGQPIHDPGKTVVSLATSREHREYLDTVHISWGEGPLGQGPTGAAIRTGVTVTVPNFSLDANYGPWFVSATARGFRSSISIPVAVRGAIAGAFMVYADEVDAFDARSVALLEDLARQLGVGLERLRDRERLEAVVNDLTLLSAAIEQAGEAIVVTGPDATILYANPAAAKSTGYSLEELVGENPRMLKSGLQDQLFYETMWSQLAGGQTWRGVLVNRRKTGTLYEEEATIGPVHDATGALIAYVAVKRDLTIERGLEANITRQQMDREVVVDVMREVRPAGTVQATAAAFCVAVNRLQFIDSALVLLLQHAGELMPVGAAGKNIDHIVLGTPVAVNNSADLLERLQGGPWCRDLSNDHELRHTDVDRIAVTAGYTAAGFAPIHWNGRPIGLLLVASSTASDLDAMTERLPVLEELGSYAGALFGEQADLHSRHEALRAGLRATIDRQRFHPVFQPVVDLASGVTVGYEALTRFDDGVRPDLRFLEAHTIGMGTELEVACVTAAITAARKLPAEHWLSINFSPATVLEALLAADLAHAGRPIVIEITEHAKVDDYPALRRKIREAGPVRLAIDDAGAGYASMKHILELRPDIVKLDISVVRGLNSDPARQALVAGLRHFAMATGIQLIAEGVETTAEAEVLLGLGVEMAQGYLYGRPAPLI